MIIINCNDKDVSIHRCSKCEINCIDSDRYNYESKNKNYDRHEK